jgi:hypothetical protein
MNCYLPSDSGMIRSYSTAESGTYLSVGGIGKADLSLRKAFVMPLSYIGHSTEYIVHCMTKKNPSLP